MPKAGKGKAHKVKVLHPNSRKAMKITGVAVRKDRIGRAHQETSLKTGVLVDKLQWFQDNMDKEKVEFSKEDLSHLVESYLHRFDDELEQIDIIQGMKGRKGRQHAAREDVIRVTMKIERNLFTTCGLEAPDLADRKNLAKFLEWDGTAKYTCQIKMSRVGTMATSTQNAPTNPTSTTRHQLDEDM